MFVIAVSRWNSRTIGKHLSQWDKKTSGAFFFSSLTQKALLSCDATATTADSMLIPVAAAGLSAASSSSSSVSCKQEEHKREKTLRCSVKN